MSLDHSRLLLLLLESALQGKENATKMVQRRERLLPLLPNHKGFAVLQIHISFLQLIELLIVK